MSLINDALKRAKETQPKTETPVAPAMHPAESARPERRTDLLMTLLVVVVLALAAVLFGLWWRSGAGLMTVRARSTQEEAPAILPVPKTVVNSHGTEATNKTAAVTEAPAIAVTNAAPTNVTAIVETPKPPPIVYKLQSVFYRPGSPTAVINGKMVYPGSRVGEARVLAIGPESATIVTASGQTNLLELP